MTRPQRVALVVILLSAAVLRLAGVDWDEYQHHHPDERYITWVATTIELPSIHTTDWAAMWQPNLSTFNPFHWPPEASSEGIVVLQNEPRDFAYGHVPLYLGVIATRVVERVAPVVVPLLPAGWTLTADVLNGAERIEFHHLTAVGRALTALFDVGTVCFVFLLGRRLYGVPVGLLAAALTALAVIHIQLAHFFTSDPYLTFFAVAALYFMVAAVGETTAEGATVRRLTWRLLVAAALVGLAIGSKFTAVLLALPLLWTAWWVGRGRGRWAHSLLLPPVALLVVAAVFALTNPFAVLDWTCPPLEAAEPLATLSRSCYAQNVMTQNGMVSGEGDLGFTRQYAGTTPYLYHFEMLFKWGLGPVVTVLGVAGLVWVTIELVRATRRQPDGVSLWARLGELPVVILLLWVVPYTVLTGSFYVKFMRYMQPVVPFLLLFGAALVWQARRREVRLALAGLAVASAAVYALAFVSIYRQEHPWNAASRWIYDNVPAGTLILSEQWDDYLPVTMIHDGQRRVRGDYPNAELTWLTYPDAADTEARLLANLELLARADYLTVLSNRVYGVAPRLPERYPLSGQYHQLLFDGALGYELVWAGERPPALLGLPIRADTFGWPGLRPPAALDEHLGGRPALSLGRADESFIVYDQPLTMIFRNTGKLTAEQMLAAFEIKN